MKFYSNLLISLLLSVCVVRAQDSENEVVPDYKNFNSQELLNWEAPKELQKEYAYYLSGFDEDGSPIWVAELGLWDTRKSVESGPDRERDFRKYVLQFLKRCEDSVKIKSTEDNPVTQFNLIVDMAGYTVRQTSTPQNIWSFKRARTTQHTMVCCREIEHLFGQIALGMALWMARQFEQAFSKSIKTGYIVNGNFVFTTVWNLMKPILGANVYKIDVFGTNRERFVPRLLSVFPKDQLPEWYGGTKDHKPVQVYG